MSALATTLQSFFTDRLIRQRQVSPNTVQSHRDTLRSLLVFASERHGKAPGKLAIDDLDAPLIGAFLDHLEHERKNSARTRNARLAAIRSLFRYAAFRHPEYAAVIQRVLAIPPNRFERRLVTYLTEAEIDALLAAPDRVTWTGRRDTALFGLDSQTGLRASELIGLSCADVHLGAGAHAVELAGRVVVHLAGIDAAHQIGAGADRGIERQGGQHGLVGVDAALAEWLGRVRLPGQAEQRLVEVHVAVHQPRQQQAATEVQHLPRVGIRRARRHDGSDAAILDGDAPPGRAAIRQAQVRQQRVAGRRGHGGVGLSRCCRRHKRSCGALEESPRAPSCVASAGVSSTRGGTLHDAAVLA